MTSFGFRIESAESGEEAIQILQRREFDVVVLDYKMPGMSGLNVLQWMYEQKLDTPVIMLTAAGSEHVAVEALKLGAYDYFRKEQLDISHFSVVLHGVYERYQFRKEKAQRELIEQERAKSLVAIETFHNTLASLTQLINHSLSISSLDLEGYKNRLKPFVSLSGRELFDMTFDKMIKENSLIASAVKSILQSANLLHGNFTDPRYASRIQETISENLKSVEQHLSGLPGQGMADNGTKPNSSQQPA